MVSYCICVLTPKLCSFVPQALEPQDSFVPTSLGDILTYRALTDAQYFRL